MKTQSTPPPGEAERSARGRVPRIVRRPVAIVPAAAEPPDEETADGRLLRPAAACPRCGSRPAMRVTGIIVRALRGADAAVRVGTYQCQRRGCGAIYDLSAGAYLRAS